MPAPTLQSSTLLLNGYVDLGTWSGITPYGVDAGYRYVNLGKARTKLDEFGVGTRTKDLSAHEVRLGVRYVID